ncbi:MAG: GNAT family N-acetyltransferase [Alphaproteobacteria bacterium GM202ARS2]|nr:GNAT family N-acetyltransferase [Alphaproteobacteria bacterium GM202ARS2]
MTLRETLLEHAPVRLEPLADSHKLGLRAAVEADTEIWTSLFPISMSGEHFDPFWKDMCTKRKTGYAMPFAVLCNQECVGFTSYLRINPDWQSLDIGGTYYNPEVRGGYVNPIAKYLLLHHAFDCGARRVQFRVDALNARSRAAMLKLGAIEEGIIRQEKPVWTGRIQDTIVFSILSNEWPDVKLELERRLSRRPQNS